MGYNIRVTDSTFTIKESNKRPALIALRQAIKSSKTLVFRSVSSASRENSIYKVGILEKMFEEFGWEAHTDPETGNITGLVFNSEKMSDEKDLFTCLAPYVEAGSYIHFLGEDSEQWKFVFDGKEMKEKKPKLIWED